MFRAGLSACGRPHQGSPPPGRAGSGPRLCPRPAVRALLALLLLLAAPPALAQPRPDAQELLGRARDALLEARASPEPATPDPPLWRAALRLAEQAAAAAPEDPAARRFLARVYSEVAWHSRAYRAWLEYLELGGTLSTEPPPGTGEPSDAALFSEAAHQLGFARYRAGDPEGALPYYRELLEHLPTDPDGLAWLARLQLELGDPAAAVAYAERLAEAHPDDPAAQAQLGVVREALAVGVPASAAYRRGLSEYEAGDLQSALASFVEALGHNGEFADAAVWAGRTALELGLAPEAEAYWQRASELRPDDDRARYFLTVAREQQRWGREATDAFYAGLAAYEQGDPESAAPLFRQAVEANAEYRDAWAWAARTLQELGRPEEAIAYWEGLLERWPADEAARYFLNLAVQQTEYGPAAGPEFLEAVLHYQQAEFAEAEAGFRRAVEANPDFAAGWGWLGRLEFEQGEYAAAADAYERALELERGNEDYAFFAAEARRLAGAVEGAGSGGADTGGANGTEGARGPGAGSDGAAGAGSPEDAGAASGAATAAEDAAVTRAEGAGADEPASPEDGEDIAVEPVLPPAP